MPNDPLIDAYLRRLDHAAAALPRERRAELVAEIREHVEDALRSEGADDEVTVRNVLERLGQPEEIAAAALGDTVAPTRVDDTLRLQPVEPEQPTVPRQPVGGLEIAALVTMAVLPVLGWFVGGVLVLMSRVWSVRDRVVALLAPPVLFVVFAVVGLLMLPPDASGLGPLELAFVSALLLFGGPLLAAYLAWRLRDGEAAIQTG
jgi:uncharacterized membrane protein